LAHSLLNLGYKSAYVSADSPATYTVSVITPAFGSITPSGTITLNEGESQVFTITPDEGYISAWVLLGGCSLGTPSRYTFTTEGKDPNIVYEIEAKFTEDTTSNWRPVETYNRENYDPFTAYNYVNVQTMVDAIKAEGHDIPVGHPKIFINVGNKQDLKQKIAQHYSAWMQEAVDLAHEKFGERIIDSGGVSDEPDAQPVVLAEALIHQMGEIAGVDYHGRTPHAYGIDGVEHLIDLVNSEPTGCGHIEYLGMPLGYDWLYDLMTASQRETVARKLAEYALPGNHFQDNYNNPRGARLLGALAIYGDGINDGLIEHFHDNLVFGDDSVQSTNLYYNGFIVSQMVVPEGVGLEGTGYACWLNPFFPILEAWYDQTGEDYFKLPFLQNTVYHYTHFNGNEYEHADKWAFTDKLPWSANRWYLVLPWLEPGLSRSNPSAASLAKHHISTAYPARLSVRLIYMLRSNALLETASPVDLELPRTAHFRGSNNIFSRDSWAGVDTTWMWFQSPQWTCVRDIGPLNDIVIWSKGGMVLGKHLQRHDYYGGNRTNTLVLYDETRPEETFIPRAVMDDANTYNLGRYIDSLTGMSKDLVSCHDGLRYFEEKENKYLYVSGDGGHAFQGWYDGNYSSETLDLPAWNRQVAWFRGDDIWVILDRIETPNEGVSAQMPLHFGPNPEIRNRSSNNGLGDGVLDPVCGRFPYAMIGGAGYVSIAEEVDDITIELIHPGIADSALSVDVEGHAITVNLKTNTEGNIDCTYLEVMFAISGDEAARAFVAAIHRNYYEYTATAAPTDGPIALTSLSVGIWKYQKADLDDIIPNRIVSTNTITTDWGTAHARLFIDTLDPLEPTYCRIGGVETRNIDLNGYLNLAGLSTYGLEEDQHNIEEGLYKVQIADPRGGPYYTFLNVLQATDSSVETPQPTTLLDGRNELGQGLIGASAGNNIAIFSGKKEQIVSGNLTMPQGIDGTYKVLTSDLRPEENYDITLDGTPILQDHPSSEAGTIYLDTVALTANQVLSVALSRIPGDVDLDRDVDIFDLFQVSNAFGTVLGDAGYNSNCDFDNDGDVDINDLYTCGSNFGVGV